MVPGTHLRVCVNILFDVKKSLGRIFLSTTAVGSTLQAVCGNRTEWCGLCQKWIRLNEQKEHEDSVHSGSGLEGGVCDRYRSPWCAKIDSQIHDAVCSLLFAHTMTIWLKKCEF